MMVSGRDLLVLILRVKTYWLALKSNPVFSGAPRSPEMRSMSCSLATLLKDGWISVSDNIYNVDFSLPDSELLSEYLQASG